MAAAAALAASAPAASAATLSAGTPCARYVPSLAGEEWIPVTGTGFTPNGDPGNNTLALNYDNGDLAGFAPAGPDGSFSANLLMPTDFISSDAGRQKTYTLTATDRETPGLSASTQVTLVRVGVELKPTGARRDPRKPVSWSVYGAPTGRTIYAHWTFAKRQRATRRLGRARGACGIARKRMPVIPTVPRRGTWTVYLTPARKLVRRDALFSVSISVFRTFR
jgi:hypothetical protein